MSELEDLRRRDSELRARLAEVEEVVEAFKNGEIDAVVQDGAATPVLLRAAQEKLREREQFLRALFDGATDAILVADASGRYIDANPAACAMFGLPRERILRRTITDFAVPGYEVPESWATFVSEGKMTGEFPLLRPDGTRRNLEFSAVANVLPGVNLSILRDVTERKIAEATIRQRQATLEHAEAVAQVGSWRSGASPTDAVSWSAGCARIFGQAPENPPTAVGFMRWVHPDDYAYVVEANQRAVAENVPCDTEHRIVLSSGEVRWVRSNAIIHGMLHWSANGFTADVDTLGRPYHVVGVVQDITERKRAEDELRASETRYRRMIENTSEGVWLIDASGVTTFVNARLAEMLGRSVEDVIGQPVFAFMDEATVHLVRRRLERRKGGVAERGDLRLVRQDGTDIWVSLHSDPIFDTNGVYEGAFALAVDITEKRKAEAALRRTEDHLRQAQKMEAIGSLAGGVAHDFNNLLSVVLSYTSLIMDEMPVGDPVRADLQEVHNAGVRATALTRQLLAFSRQQVLEPTVVDLNEIVKGVAKMLARLVGEDVTISVSTGSSLGRVHADVGQIEQVITNLAVNARDAMPGGGQLTIETSDVDVSAEDALGHKGLTPGRYVVLAITDSGIGMDPPTLERIFEPFFTTKDKGRGTGLGLATVYGIVQQSGGHITVDSEPGKGTSFKVFLPRTDRTPQSTKSAPPANAAVPASETVLLVEDEDQVRAVMRSVLRKNGYTVLEAQNGGEAFLICEKHPGAIHLLLTDVILPRMSGREVAERLTQLRPDMRLLYVSGHANDTIGRHGMLETGTAFLQKPITPAALLRKVRDVLDASSRPAPIE